MYARQGFTISAQIHHSRWVLDEDAVCCQSNPTSVVVLAFHDPPFVVAEPLALYEATAVAATLAATAMEG